MAKRLAEVGQKKRQPGCHMSLFDQVVWKQNQLGNLLSNSCRSEMIRTSRFPVNWSNTWTNVTLHVVELVTLASFVCTWRFDNLARHSDHKVEPDIKWPSLQTYAKTYHADISHAALHDTGCPICQKQKQSLPLNDVTTQWQSEVLSKIACGYAPSLTWQNVQLK